MDPKTFDHLRELIYRESGIVLKEEKKSLLINRIQKRLRQLELQKVEQYVEIIESDATGQEMIELIDAISTNVTHFYREPAHFELLGTILQEWQAKGKKDFKIWCAAASSGEEPFTLAITVAENLNLRQSKCKILATDICTKVLKRAQAGIYGEKSLENVAPELRDKYFQHSKDKPGLYKATPTLSSLLLFKRLNLVQYPYPLNGPIDIIFCRNVMIYFDVATRAKIINQFERLLSPGGHLFISHSESLLGVAHSLQRVNTSVFKKAE